MAARQLSAASQGKSQGKTEAVADTADQSLCCRVIPRFNKHGGATQPSRPSSFAPNAMLPVSTHRRKNVLPLNQRHHYI